MESSKDLQAEIHPLKAEEGKAPGKDHANCAKKEGASSRTAGRLSRWRTAAFFLSLFLCLTVVFAFSFVIPCPVRPVSQRTWNRTYDDAVAYQFLAVGDVDRDRVQDVLFAFRASSGGDSSSSLNSSCSDEGFASPCAFLAALSGTNGRMLWQKPVAEELLVVDCSLVCDRSPACLVVGKPDSVTALDLNTGQSLWKQSTNFGANSTVLNPLLEVPDVDGDGVSDFLIFTAVDKKEIKSWFFSGKYGALIGSQGSLSLPGWVGHLLQVTKTGAHYVLFCTASALYGYSVNELYHTAIGMAGHRGLSLTEDPRWAVAIDSISHRVSMLSSGEIRYLKKMPGRSGTNILVVRSAMLELLDGQHLGSMWASSIPHALSEPVFGAYDSDAVDVIIESRVTPNKKKVMIVEGSSGAVDWETELLWGAGSPKAGTLATADHRSIFLFWGTHQVAPNTTKPEETQQQQQHLYLFHPTLPNVLLEMSSVQEPIVAFEAVLLERSRHACYILLMGPQAGGVPGQVVVSKRKLKEDLAGSHVLWLNQVAQEAEQSVRDRFLRMRYRSLG